MLLVILLDSNTEHSLVCVIRNLIAFSEDGSDPYVRLYLLPDKRRSGRRKTHVSKKTLNPVFDQRYASTQRGRQLCSPLKEGLVVPWND